MFSLLAGGRGFSPIPSTSGKNKTHPSPPQAVCVIIRHPGQIPPGGMRAGIQNGLIDNSSPGFPFDFAQGGESFDLAQDRELVERPVEPRVSLNLVLLARNDSFVELRHSLGREGIGEGNITLTQVS